MLIILCRSVILSLTVFQGILYYNFEVYIFLIIRH